MGAATATYVQAKPTISNTTLTARFMVFLLCATASLGAETERDRIIGCRELVTLVSPPKLPANGRARAEPGDFAIPV